LIRIRKHKVKINFQEERNVVHNYENLISQIRLTSKNKDVVDKNQESGSNLRTQRLESVMDKSNYVCWLVTCRASNST